MRARSAMLAPPLGAGPGGWQLLLLAGLSKCCFSNKKRLKKERERNRNRATPKASGGGGGAFSVRMRELLRGPGAAELRREGRALKRNPESRSLPQCPPCPGCIALVRQPLLGPEPSLAAMRAAPPGVQSGAYMGQSYRLTEGESFFQFQLLPIKPKEEERI